MVMSYLGCLDVIGKHRTEEIVIGGMTARHFWCMRSTSERDIVYSDPMGTMHPMAFGIALAQPSIGVWVLNGDGSLLMNLGSLATIAEAAPPNLIHFLFNNGVYAMPGKDPIANADNIDFCAIARGAGWRSTHEPRNVEDLDLLLPQLIREPGPHFVNLKVDAPIDTSVPNYRELATNPVTVIRYGRSGVLRVEASLAGKK